MSNHTVLARRWLVLFLLHWPLLAVAEDDQVSLLSNQQMRVIIDLFSLLLQGEQPVADAWQQAGLDLKSSDEHYFIRTDQQQLFGLGHLWLQKDIAVEARPVMLQAPHQYYDLFTGDIGRRLYQDGGFIGYMENTVQRYASEHADQAHVKNSLYIAFSRAFQELHPRARVIQLHGFDAAKRVTEEGRSADLIISNGSVAYDNSLRSLQICMRNQVGMVARVYGLDVYELGATRNEIGKQLNLKGDGNFIHLEMSERIREQYGKKGRLEAMSRCLRNF